MAEQTKQTSLPTTEKAEEELERKLFYLKTLYDVSRDLLGTVEMTALLRKFLFMTTGNFGVIEGFLLLQQSSAKNFSPFAAVGFEKEIYPDLLEWGEQMLAQGVETEAVWNGSGDKNPGKMPTGIVCALPFRVDDSCTGLLALGGKIVEEPYSDDDKELVTTLINNLVSALKNARYAQALKEAYEEVSSLNRAKDKVIDHLSHELLTPIALLKGSLRMLRAKLAPFPEDKWKKTLDRAERNLQRLGEIQGEVDDIIQGKELKNYRLLNDLLDDCSDALEVFAAEEAGEGPLLARIRNRIEETFGPRDCLPEPILLDRFVRDKLAQMNPSFAHREVEVITKLDTTPAVIMPKDPLEKIVVGLVKNAIENTPEEGEVEVTVGQRGDGVQLLVKDTGIGIVMEHQKRIFEGFFHTQETDDYSTKRPFDFNAGGKGADLLRMKIFSERYNFKLTMSSSRCGFIPETHDVCPGRISVCPSCQCPEDCYQSGGTLFEVFFPITANREVTVQDV